MSLFTFAQKEYTESSNSSERKTACSSRQIFLKACSNVVRVSQAVPSFSFNLAYFLLLELEAGEVSFYLRRIPEQVFVLLVPVHEKNVFRRALALRVLDIFRQSHIVSNQLIFEIWSNSVWPRICLLQNNIRQNIVCFRLKRVFYRSLMYFVRFF